MFWKITTKIIEIFCHILKPTMIHNISLCKNKHVVDEVQDAVAWLVNGQHHSAVPFEC